MRQQQRNKCISNSAVWLRFRAVLGMNTTPATFASKVEQNAENVSADNEGKKTNEEIVIMFILPNINAAEINERLGFY